MHGLSAFTTAERWAAPATERKSLRGVAQLFVQRGSQQRTGLIARKFLDPGFCHGRDVAEDLH
jgi:hypothetical protein